MSKNTYMIIRISTDIRANSTAPRVVYANIPEASITKNDFETNHIFTNKRTAKRFADTLNMLHSKARCVQYKVFQIKEVA